MTWGLTAYSIVRDSAGAPIGLAAQLTDITPRKTAQHGLMSRIAGLERSKADPEEFAYLASRDLQEPLRTIASYSQLLSEQYVDLIEPRGRRWIQRIVQGCERLRRLIDGLLALAQVRTTGAIFAPTDLGALAERAWNLLTEMRHISTASSRSSTVFIERRTIRARGSDWRSAAG